MALAKSTEHVATLKGPKGDVGQWPENTLLLSTTDLKALAPGAYSPISGTAAGAMGLPTSTYGTLIKYEWSQGGAMHWVPATSAGNQIWQNIKVGSSWQGWGRVDHSVNFLSGSLHADDLPDGTYTNLNASTAISFGLPAANIGPLVQVSVGQNRSQTWTPISNTPRIYTRSKVGSNFSPWYVYTPDSGGSDGGTVTSSVEREMRVARANARRGGLYGTGGLAVFSLMFDHGTNNFVNKVLPLLIKHNLPAGLGLNSQMYSASYTFKDSDDQTSFSQLQTMALQHGVSIWNHGRLHNAGGESEIVGGRDELTASLPQIPVENWLHTGTYGDFASGHEFENYWKNTIGSVIMNSHAYLTGDIQEPVKPLSGQLKPGYDGTWVDGGQSALNILKSQIQQSQTVGGGVMMRQHPMYIDREGNITTAQLDTFLTWVAAERDAGRLLVLTPDLLNLADADRTRRRNLVAGNGGTGDQGRLIPATMYELARGSVNEIHAKVRLSTAGTIRLQVTGTGLSASKTFTVPANTWVDLRKYFTIPLTGTADLNVTCWALSGSGLQVETLNVFPG